MTPLTLEILIHAFSSFGLFPRPEAPAVVSAVHQLQEAGVLVGADLTQPLELTPLGRAWLNAILSTPIPRTVYLDAAGNPIEPI